MISLSWKKTKTGRYVVIGPYSVLRTGMDVLAVSQSGSSKRVTIKSLGKPFDSGGTRMVYGYITGPDGVRSIGESLQDVVDELK